MHVRPSRHSVPEKRSFVCFFYIRPVRARFRLLDYHCVLQRSRIMLELLPHHQQVTLSFLASLNLTESNLSDQKLIDKMFRRFIRADAKDWTNVTKREILTKVEENDRKNNSEYTLNGRWMISFIPYFGCTFQTMNYAKTIRKIGEFSQYQVDLMCWLKCHPNYEDIAQKNSKHVDALSPWGNISHNLVTGLNSKETEINPL